MMYFRYVYLGLIAGLATLLTYILSIPLAAYSVLVSIDNLPYPFYYLQTFDDTLDGGTHQNPPNWALAKTKLGLVWQRAKWLCRNPAAGVKQHFLSPPIEGTKEQIIVNQGEVETKGYKFFSILTAPDGKKYFCYRTYRCYFGWNRWSYMYGNTVNMTLKFRIKLKW